MFHFWFNTFFLHDEETTTLDYEIDSWECSMMSLPGNTKMKVTRTQSDQTRVVDRVVAEQRRLHKQLNNELLRRSRRVESTEHLNLPKSYLPLTAAQFYDRPTNSTRQLPPPSPRTYKVLRLSKGEIDRANKDKQHRLYPANFAVKLYFLPADEAEKLQQDSLGNKLSESSESNGSLSIVTAGSNLELSNTEDDDDSLSDTDDDEAG